MTTNEFATVRTDSQAIISAHGQITAKARRFLSARLNFATDGECCEDIGIDQSSVTMWKREVPAFRAAYDDLMTNGIEEWAQQERRRLLGKALLTAESLMEAEDTVYTKNGDAIGKQVNHRARRDGAEIVMRANRMWNPQERQNDANAPLLAAINALADIKLEAERRKSRVTIEGEAKELPNPEG